MVFSSHLFCFYFLPFAVAVYFALPRRAKNLGLTLLSYLFYGWAHPAFVFLMLFSTAVDYVCGQVIERNRDDEESDGEERRRKAAVVASIVTNLSLLGFFKYFNFGVDSWNTLIVAWGLESLALDVTLRVTLPLGISFYTFQSMSYTIDVYRGRFPALRNPVDFACYVSMFPQLVAGPIIRFNEVAEQLHERSHTIAKAARGAAFFSCGMAKKILLANPCGKVADLAFGAESLHAVDAWLGAVAYGFQIYFDFSGYSDMAIGLALIFGFALPKNFDSPYRSRSITEFWRRWHMSLSRWLRDYLYIPLGGNRKGPRRTYVNLLLVMLLGGLWHGAAWNFLAWGAFHAFFLALERTRGKEASTRRLPEPLRVAWTFLLVTLSWVLFRAANLGEATDYFAAMLGFGEPAPQAAMVGDLLVRPYYLLTLLAAAAVTWLAPQAWDFTRRLTAPKAALCLLYLVAALVMMESQGFNPFIYFIF